MHIVQTLAALSLGGSELVAAELCDYLCSQGHQVTVLAADGPLGERVRNSGAHHLDWPVNRKKLATLGYIKRFRKWLLEEQPDIVHAHSRLPAWICWRAIQGLPEARRPVFITTMHGHYSVNFYSGVMAKGERVIAVSKVIKDYTLNNYPGVEAKQVPIVYGGASREEFPYGYQPDPSWWLQVYKEFPELKGKRLLCLPGRMTRYKGHGVFLQLISRLRQDFPDIHGVIVGSFRPGSKYMRELDALIDSYGIDAQVTFTGGRTDMRDWMAASSLQFSLCSQPPEAFGRTVLEALSLGRPVVAWDHGGVAEILAEMFPAGAVKPDDTQALESVVREFLANSPVVEKSDAFSLSESMSATLAVYQNVYDQQQKTREASTSN